MSLKSRDTFVVDGSTAVFNLSFPFINRSHVNVLVNGVLQAGTDYTWLSNSSIQLNSTPAADSVVALRRISPTTPVVDYQNGAVLTEAELDLSLRQMLYLHEELQDAYEVNLEAALVALADANGVIYSDAEAVMQALIQYMLEQDVSAELLARISDINTNAEGVLSNTEALNQEVTDRVTAVAQEVTDRINAINTETSDRVAAITAETNARIAALLAEAGLRSQGLADEAAARASELAAEAASRVSDVANLQQQVNDLAGSVAGEVYVQPDEPVPGVAGVPDPIADNARWYDSDDNNHPYIYQNSAWQDLDDPRIGSAQADISALESSLTTAEGDIVANATAIGIESTRVTNLDGVLTTESARIDQLEADYTSVDGKADANASAVSTLVSRVDVTETDITTVAADITTLEAGLSTAEGEITATSTALTALDTRVTDSEGDITSQASQLTTLETRLNTVADIPVYSLRFNDQPSNLDDLTLWGDSSTVLATDYDQGGSYLRATYTNGSPASSQSEGLTITLPWEISEVLAGQSVRVRIRCRQTDDGNSAVNLSSTLYNNAGQGNSGLKTLALPATWGWVDYVYAMPALNPAALSREVVTLRPDSTGSGLSADFGEIVLEITGADLESFPELSQRALLANLQQSRLVRVTADNAQASRLDSLESTVDDPTNGVAATATALDSLDTRVTISEGSITAQSSDITQLQSDVTAAQGDATANAGAISSLDTRVTSTEDDITAQASDITALESGLTAAQGDATANAGAISSLDTRVTATESDITSQASDITQLQSDVSAAQGDADGNATALSALTTRVTATEGETSAQADDITLLQSDVVAAQGDATANASAITGLDTRVTATESGLTSQSSDITALNNRLANASSDNLIPFPSFTGIDDPNDHFSVFNGSTVNLTRVEGVAENGGDVLQLASNSLYQVAILDVLRYGVPATAGDVVYIRARIRVSADFDGAIGLGFRAHNINDTGAGGGGYRWVQTDLNNLTPGSWQTLEHAITLADSTTVKIVPFFSTRIDATVGNLQVANWEASRTPFGADETATSAAYTVLESRVSDAEGELVSQASDTTILSSQLVSVQKGELYEAYDGEPLQLDQKPHAIQFDIQTNASGRYYYKLFEADLIAQYASAGMSGTLYSGASSGRFRKRMDFHIHLEVVSPQDILGQATYLWSGDDLTVNLVMYHELISGTYRLTVYADLGSFSGIHIDAQVRARYAANTWVKNVQVVEDNIGAISAITPPGTKKAPLYKEWGYDDLKPTVDASATAVTSLDTRVTATEGDITAQASDITQLSTSIGDNTATISTQATSINGLEAKYGVTINTGGRVTGYSLNGTPAETSFDILADRFTVVNPTDDSQAVQAMVFENGNLSLKGTVKADRFLANAPEWDCLMDDEEVWDLVLDDTGNASFGLVADTAAGVEAGNTAMLLYADGSGVCGIATKQAFPFDPTATYEIRVVLRKSGAVDDNVYAGLIGVAGDGVTKVNILGNDSVGSQHYIAASNKLIDSTDYIEAVGYVHGYGAVNGVSGSQSPDLAGSMHPDVRFFRPMVYVGYGASNNPTVNVARFTVRKIPTYITAGNINKVMGAAITPSVISYLDADLITVGTLDAERLLIDGEQVKVDEFGRLTVGNISDTQVVSNTNAAAASWNGASEAATTGQWAIGTTMNLAQIALPATLNAGAKLSFTTPKYQYTIQGQGQPAGFDVELVRQSDLVVIGSYRWNTPGTVNSEFGALTIREAQLTMSGIDVSAIDGQTLTVRVKVWSASNLATTYSEFQGNVGPNQNLTQLSGAMSATVTESVGTITLTDI